MMLVVGVDACPNGHWLVVPLSRAGFGEPKVEPSFREVLRAHSQAEIVAVDIPIGLPPPYPRRADEAARRFVGLRRSSVFPVYPREAYEAPTREEGDAISRRLIRRGLGSHGYGMGQRILEVERRLVRRVREAHPEVSFRALAGEPLRYSKHTDLGRDQRRALLSAVGDLPRQLRGAREHDILDAAVAAWSALRIARGEAQTLPSDPAEGEPRIWY